jgi:hypothetical protein
MKKTESNKNTCIMYNRQSTKYTTVALGTNEHINAIRQGYEYRGPVYVANMTEAITMREANEAFMKHICAL